MKKVILFFLFIFCFDLYGRYNIVADFTLKNGLRVICIDQKTLPIVCFSVLYKCGAANETPSESGVAHFLEHMAFCGDKGEFSSFLEEVGAEYNAFTCCRSICFYEILPVEYLEVAFRYEARRMETLDIDQEKFLSEKEAILEERSMSCDNTPQGQYIETICTNLFSHVSEWTDPIGWRHEIEAAQPQDLIDFHNKWFAPNNAIMLLVGDIDIGQVKFLAEKYFARISPKEIVKVNRDVERPKQIKKIELRSTKIGTCAEVDYTYFVSFEKNNFRKNAALLLVSRALNQPTFFAKKTLENILNKAISISFGYDYGNYLHDIFQVSISCSSINNLAECEELWPYLKRKILAHGITKAELNAVKRQITMGLAYRDQDIRTIFEHIWWDISCGYSIEQIRSMDEVMQSITLGECNAVLKEVLGPQYMAISRMLPKEHDRD